MGNKIENIEKRELLQKMKSEGVSKEEAARRFKDSRYVERWWDRDSIKPQTANNRLNTGLIDGDSKRVIVELYRLLLCSYESFNNYISRLLFRKRTLSGKPNLSMAQDLKAGKTKISFVRTSMRKIVGGCVKLPRTRKRWLSSDLAIHAVKISWARQSENTGAGKHFYDFAWLLLIACRYDITLKKNKNISKNDWDLKWYVYPEKPSCEEVERCLVNYIDDHRAKKNLKNLTIHQVMENINGKDTPTASIDVKRLRTKKRRLEILPDACSTGVQGGITDNPSLNDFTLVKQRLAEFLGRGGHEVSVAADVELTDYSGIETEIRNNEGTGFPV